MATGSQVNLRWEAWGGEVVGERGLSIHGYRGGEEDNFWSLVDAVRLGAGDVVCVDCGR